MKARVEKIFEKLSPVPEALVIANSIEPHLDQSFFYVFDVPSGLFEGAVAIAHADGKVDLLTSPLEEESAVQATKQDHDITIHVPKGPKERDQILTKLLPAEGSIALHNRELTYEWFLTLQKLLPKAQWSDASAAIRSARMTKDADEIARLDRAAQIASKVGMEIPSMLHVGITELELAAEIEYHLSRYGASGRSFQTIVGFGRNSAEPHYSPSDVKLEKGANIVCDFGALYRRYCSDITRSFRFGPVDDEMKKVHETVQAAQAAAFATIRPGVVAKDVHMAAQKVIDDSPWKGRFTHGLGHSIGLAVHDGFGMGPNADEPLEVGMAITVEPGIYLPGHGGVRIEDDIVVTKDGYRFLTTTRREYIEVPA